MSQEWEWEPVEYISAVIHNVRERAKEDGLGPDRAPPWAEAARIEAAEVNDTRIYLIEEADGDGD